MIEQLDNNEQILLMYLADELPQDDRLQVERLLGADVSLRLLLEQLQSAQQSLEIGLAEWDESSPLPAEPHAVVRRVIREIRQRMALSLHSEKTVERERRVWSVRWVYPVAAAAVLALVLGIWATYPSSTTHQPQSEATNYNYPQEQPQPDNDVLFLSLDDDADFQAVAMSSQGSSDVMPKDELTDLMLDEQPLN